jgi:hypothetical protein
VHARDAELSDFDRGVIVGLVLGEGSFSGDGRAPSLTIGMHVRHRELLEWVRDRLPGAMLYGPYHHAGRDFFRLLVRGPALRHVLARFDDDISRLCPHVAGRIERMRERYVWALMPRGGDP